MIGTKPHKSDSRREKEHEQYVKAKSSRNGKYRVFEKKKHPKRDSNHKMLLALMGFIASSLSIILLPFGLLHSGYKSIRKRREARKTVHKNAPRITYKQQPLKTTQNKDENHNLYSSSAFKPDAQNSNTENKTNTNKKTLATQKTEPSYTVSIESEVSQNAPDENVPKSIPKNDNDQYIRKRMIISDSSHCDKDVLSRLQIGSYLEVVADQNNLYDKDALKLLHVGEKVGYIHEKDKLPFLTCLKLGRRVYGVITDIIDDELPVKYEFETWLENE